MEHWPIIFALLLIAVSVFARSKMKQRVKNKHRPEFSFGVIADVQYADLDSAWNFAKDRQRHYRHALNSVVQGVQSWNKTENLKCVVQLGDVIDGKNKKSGQSKEALSRVLSEFNKLKTKEIHHCIGNHELYNFDRKTAAALLHPTDGKQLYYSFSPARGWRFIILDCYEISICGHKEGDPIYEQSMALLKKNNHNDMGDNSDWHDGIEGLQKRWVPYNGGVSSKQLEFLESTIKKAQKMKEKVIVLSHVPLYVHATRDLTLVWNYDEVLTILHRYKPSVVAVLCGHDHDGGYAKDEAGIHHVTFNSPLECGLDHVAYGTIHVFPTFLKLTGYGTILSRDLTFEI